MQWKGRRRSQNVEDRRTMGAPRRGAVGGAGLLRLLPMLLGRRGGKSGLIIILLLVGAQFMGVDLGAIMGGSPMTAQMPAGSGQRQAPPSAAEDELADFVSVVLADTEETWHQLFSQMGGRYKEPTLVLYRGAVKSACGLGQAAMGPFYCPGDQKVYIDLSFYDDLRSRHGAPGDFAQAYVVAHEIGHHVQTLLGISKQVHAAKSKVSEVQANQLSVRQELQADCFAGIWGHYADRARNLLEQGDLEEAMRAAAAIGDDRLQKQGRGYVTPESFTHGSSEQRVRWFRKGMAEGSVKACDTFSARSL